MAKKEHGKSRQIINLAFGLVILGVVIAFVVATGDRRKYAELLAQARPGWLALALLFQLGTYACASMVWRSVLREEKAPPSIPGLAPLAIAKLSVDQLIPTTGVGGTLLVVRGLRHKGISKAMSVATVIVDLVSFYAAHALAVIATLVILLFHHDLNIPVLVATAIFGVLAVTVPWLVLKVHNKGTKILPAWLMKISAVRSVFESLKGAAREPIRSPAVLTRATFWQFGVFLLDAATLGVMLVALGRPVQADVVFASLTLTTMIATLSIFPGALGMFEAGSVAGLTLLGVPMEAALAATLLMRLFNFWLPMIPGLMITRKLSAHHVAATA
jgi:uncharacterized protein (TIRG00374 family)